MEGQNQKEEGTFVFRDSIAEWVKRNITEVFDNEKQMHIFHFWCWKNALFEEENKRNWQFALPHKTYCDLVSCGGDPVEYVARQISVYVAKQISKDIQKNS